MKKLREFLPHLCISMCLGLAVICVLDGYNPNMSFLTSDPSKIYIFVTCALGFLTGVDCVVRQRARKKRPK